MWLVCEEGSWYSRDYTASLSLDSGDDFTVDNFYDIYEQHEVDKATPQFSKIEQLKLTVLTLERCIALFHVIQIPS